MHKACVQYKETSKQDTMAHTCIHSIVEMKYKDHKIQGDEITFQKKQSKARTSPTTTTTTKKGGGSREKGNTLLILFFILLIMSNPEKLTTHPQHS